MRKAILQFIGCIVGVAASAYFMPGVYFADWEATLAMGLVLAVLFLLLRPIARLFLAVFNMLTLGLIYLAADTFFVLLATNLIDGFALENYWWAVAVAIAANVGRHILGGLSRN